MKQKISLGEFIYQLRKAKGLTQLELADKVGVSNKAVSKWETGESNPEINNLPILAQELGISVDELLNCEIKEENKHEKTEYKNSFIGIAGTVNKEPWHYEFVSNRKTRKGKPFVHINIGLGMYKANGVVAIGTIASGFISIGLVSIGILSIGVLALGLISIACIALGLIFATGSFAIGAVAIGGIAIGGIAIGGVAIGYLSIGGLSIGVHAYTGEDGKAYGRWTYILTSILISLYK